MYELNIKYVYFYLNVYTSETDNKITILFNDFTRFAIIYFVFAYIF